MGQIKNIIFDIGGVLVDLDRRACIDAFRAIGYPQADELLNTYHQKGVFGELEKGAVSPHELYGHISAEVGRPIEPKLIDDALNSFFIGMPVYKLDMLASLRSRFKTYTLSNTNAIMFPYIDKHLFSQRGLRAADYFDRLFLSYEMGLLKPDPAIFEEVLSHADISADETLFIDDALPNIEVAASMGFHVYQAVQGQDFSHIFDEL